MAEQLEALLTTICHLKILEVLNDTGRVILEGNRELSGKKRSPK